MVSCGGTMTDEQRKQMLEARKQRAIVKVTEARLTEAAFSRGREIMKQLERDSSVVNRNTLEEEFGASIKWLEPGSANALQIEAQLIDAYINGLLMNQPLQDNVQRVGSDSLLYTKPVTLTRQDGSLEINGTWNVWLSKKSLVLSLSRE